MSYKYKKTRQLIEQYLLAIKELSIKLPEYLLKIFKDSKVLPIELVGSNWVERNDLPIALCFGFNPWKRQVVSTYLNEYRTAFVLGNASFIRVQREFLSTLSQDMKVNFVFWGAFQSTQFKLYLWLYPSKIGKILRVEDGFIRSIGTGLTHTRPYSLCVDDVGIYFDATRPSRLEIILSTFDFDAEEVLLQRAKSCLALMQDARLTKYYDFNAYAQTNLINKGRKYTVLVIGQVENDASILNGHARITKNIKLVLQAKKDFPEAEIIYRPHPDYWHKTRNSHSSNERISQLCTLIPPEVSLYSLFAVVDHVYTITSLSGFEALLHGLKVTCFGVPFYAGWGLTEDRSPIKRRGRNLSREALFAAAYLLYPRYLHPQSDESSTFEEVATYMICESLKFENIFDPGVNWALFEKTIRHLPILTQPFRVLVDLEQTRNFSAASQNMLAGLTQKESLLADYPIISHYLIRTSNFDALVQYSNYAVEIFRLSTDVVRKNTTLTEAFLYALTVAQQNTNGRVIDSLPDITHEIIRIPIGDRNFQNIIKNYVRCLSSGLQYQLIERLLETCASLSAKEDSVMRIGRTTFDQCVEEFSTFRLSISNYRILVQTLKIKPARSERDSAFRHRLIKHLANLYKRSLDSEHDTPLDKSMNNLLVAVYTNQYSLASKIWKEVHASIVVNEESRNLKKWIQYRIKDFSLIADYFIKINNINFVEQIIKLLEHRDVERTRLLKLKVSRKLRKDTDFLTLLGPFESFEGKTEQELSVFARFQRERGFFDEAISINLELKRRARTVTLKAALIDEIQKLKFILASSVILNSHPQPQLPKGVVFVASQTCFNTMAMIVPALAELKRLGYAVVNLCGGMSAEQQTGLEYIDKFHGAIPLDLVPATGSFSNEWLIDWKNRKLMVDGINVYQGFYERLSTYSRRFHVEINQPQISDQFLIQLQRSDLCLSICKGIFKEVVGRGIPATFVTGNSHVTPFSIFRDFARAKDHPLLGFVNCNVAYESYFSNLGSKFANTMCVTDMTLHPNIRAPFLARRDQFERWYHANKNKSEFQQRAEDLINVNRVGSSSDTKEEQLIGLINRMKRQGKKIVCAFGKVPVDLCVPYDGGPAHTGIPPNQ